MSDKKTPDTNRRKIVVATTVVGGAAALGAAIPFAASMMPSDRAKAAGAPIEVDLSKLVEGELGVYEWRGKPVWVMKRTKAMKDAIDASASKTADPDSKVSSQQPDYAKNKYRSIKDDVMVLVGICTHLGCSPKQKSAEERAEMGQDWAGGFYCPCHGSKFDLAGRVYKGVPAPTNLEVPPHQFLSDTTIVIGDDKKGA